MTLLFRDTFALLLMPFLAQEIPAPEPAHLSSWVLQLYWRAKNYLLVASGGGAYGG